jgi:hypothetical protein
LQWKKPLQNAEWHSMNKINIISMNDDDSNTIDVGSRIATVLKSKGLNVSWLAKQMHYERANIYNIFHRKSIDTELLRKISVILENNFFDEISRIIEKQIKEQ